MMAVGQNRERLTVLPNPGDPDKQSLLIRYPSVAASVGYVAPFVKIESGAKSALDPNEERLIVPYIAADALNGKALTVVGVTTINPERTFLDKILILHGLPIYFAKYGRPYTAGSSDQAGPLDGSTSFAGRDSRCWVRPPDRFEALDKKYDGKAAAPDLFEMLQLRLTLACPWARLPGSTGAAACRSLTPCPALPLPSASANPRAPRRGL